MKECVEGLGTERPDLAKIRMFHTRIVNESILGMIRQGELQALELDISLGLNGLYIGHHESYYQDRNYEFPPHNVPVRKAMEVIVKYNVFVKFDCKDEGAISGIPQLITQYSLDPNKFMLHAYITELDFHQGERKPEWEFENISLDKIIQLREIVGGPSLQVSCRGFDYEGIEDTNSQQVANLFKVFKLAKENEIEVINLNLPNNKIAPDWVLKYFNDGGILVEFYEANVGDRELPCNVFTSMEVDN